MNKEPVPLDVDNAPPLGTLVVHRGVEAVFTHNKAPIQGCHSCAYDPFCGTAPGQGRIECPGGVYVAKQAYLEMKLLGEIT